MPLFSKVKDIFQRGSSAKKKKVYHNVSLNNPEESWDIVGELGDGAYGKVYKALNKATKNLAALKLVPLEEEEDLDNFMIEIDILSECQHRNIVQLLEAYHWDGKLWMYLEYCDGGAVDSIMVDLDRPLSEKQIAFICRELLQSLKYLHAQKIIHRDVKAGNVLLTMEGGVKLADFGVSAKNKNTMDKRGTFIGTPYWLAPEVILCETFLDANYDYKADIWSLGITLIEFAEMDPPNHEVSPVRVMLKIQKSDPPRLLRANRFSKNFSDFLLKCLVKDPNHRPSATELLNHPFVSQDLEKKPVVELLLEYKAEVVEEDVEDESEDHDPSRLSMVTDLSSSGSPFNKSNNEAGHDPSESPQISEENSVAERKLSKGPAPLPPPVATVPSPSKRQAPTRPDPSSPDVHPTNPLAEPKSEKTPTKLNPITIPSPVTSPTSEKTPTQSPISTPTSEKGPSPKLSPVTTPTSENTSKPGPVCKPSSDTTTPTVQIVSNPTPEKTPVNSPTSEQVPTPRLSPVTTPTSDTHVCPDPKEVCTSVPQSTSKILIENVVTADAVAEQVNIAVAVDTDGVVTVNHQPLPVEDATSVHETSVVEIKDCTDVAIISPEGSPDSLVTVTVVDINDVDTVSGKTSPHTLASTMSSISEAEAQAVLMLDSAIDSAIDTALDSPIRGNSMDEPFPSESPLPTQPTGAVVVITPGLPDESDVNIFSHKPDESEVIISNSSILQEDSEPTEIAASRLEVILEPESPVKPVGDHANISVVAVEETLPQVEVITSSVEEQRTITSIDVQPTSEPLATPPDSPDHTEPLQPLANGIKRQDSKFSDKSDTWSSVSSDKENQHKSDPTEDVELRREKAFKKVEENTLSRNQEKSQKERQDFLARRKTRKRTRRFEIDGVIVTTTTSKVIYGDDEEGTNSSAHLARKQELREIKILQKQEQKQFQELSAKAEQIRVDQERRFEMEKFNLLKNFDTQIELLNRQQKQLVEKAETRQEMELKGHSKKLRADQERDLKSFKESLKQESKLLKCEVNRIPKETRKEAYKVKKDQLDQDQTEREKHYLDKLNENHEISVKRLNDAHREHIALKEKQFLEEKHQLMRSRENALWETEEKHLQDKHQLAKEQLKDVYYLQRHQMVIRHNKELEQVRRMNQHKEDELLKRQAAEKRQLPKRIRQEMKTREKMFREKIRISMPALPTHDQEKDQLKRFQEQEKIKYDAEKQRAERKHRKQLEELRAATEYAIKELEILQNEKGKMLMEHEHSKLKSLDEEYHKELKGWKSQLVPRKQKLEDSFERQLGEQERFYGEYLNKGLSSTPSLSVSSLASSVAGSTVS